MKQKILQKGNPIGMKNYNNANTKKKRNTLQTLSKRVKE